MSENEIAQEIIDECIDPIEMIHFDYNEGDIESTLTYLMNEANDTFEMNIDIEDEAIRNSLHSILINKIAGI